jgi:hypothetical protein
MFRAAPRSGAQPPCAQVAELVDAQVSGTCARKGVEVRVFSWAPPRFRKKARDTRHHDRKATADRDAIRESLSPSRAPPPDALRINFGGAPFREGDVKQEPPPIVTAK